MDSSESQIQCFEIQAFQVAFPTCQRHVFSQKGEDGWVSILRERLVWNKLGDRDSRWKSNQDERAMEKQEAGLKSKTEYKIR